MSKLIAELYKSRNILLDQLEIQEYDVSDFTGCSIQEINIMQDKNQMDMLIHRASKEKKDNNDDKIYIKYYYNGGKQLTIKNLDDLIIELYEKDDEDEVVLSKKDTLLIISSQAPNESLTRRLKELWDIHGHYVSIINLARLQYNVLNHDLVPKHTPVRNRVEIERIKGKYSIEENDQFPTISRFDPVALAIGLKPDELCKIYRPSKTAILTPYYRMCVNI